MCKKFKKCMEEILRLLKIARSFGGCDKADVLAKLCMKRKVTSSGASILSGICPEWKVWYKDMIKSDIHTSEVISSKRNKLGRLRRTGFHLEWCLHTAPALPFCYFGYSTLENNFRQKHVPFGGSTNCHDNFSGQSQVIRPSWPKLKCNKKEAYAQ